MNDNFLKAMIVAGAHYRREVTKELVKSYAEFLEPRDMEQCAAAVKTHISTNRYFPLVCDIIDAVEGDNNEKATRAWDRAYKLFEDSQDAKTDDPVLEKVVSDMGGWLILGTTNYEQLRFKQHDFIKRYMSELRHVEFTKFSNLLETDSTKLISKEGN